MNNVTYIWTPHYNSGCFRVAARKQMGQKNYIIVCCSPQYNGVWVWDAKDKGQCTKWVNNGLICYCVPMEICTKVQELDTITNPTVLKYIKKNQQKFCERYRKKDEQSWTI